MHIINTSKRLIDFSWNRKKYRLMPAGDAVEVPDSAMGSAFLKSLIKDGEISEVKEMTAAEKTAAKLSQLQTDAKALGIEFDDDTSAKDLTAAIKEAEEEKKEEEEKAAQQQKEADELEALRKQATALGVEFDDDWTAEDIANGIEFDELAKKATGLGIKVKDTWDIETLQKEIKKKEK